MIDVDDVDNPLVVGDAVAGAVFASSCPEVSLEGLAQSGAQSVRIVAQRPHHELDAGGRNRLGKGLGQLSARGARQVYVVTLAHELSIV